MNTRIYNKIRQLVRIVPIKDDEGFITNYLVQSRHTKKGDWKTNLETISEKKAVQKKHFQTLIALRDLRYDTEFLFRKKLRRDREYFVKLRTKRRIKIKKRNRKK